MVAAAEEEEAERKEEIDVVMRDGRRKDDIVGLLM